MYRRPKFLEVLLQIREQMARDADYDVDRFAEMVRSGNHKNGSAGLSLTDESGPAANSKTAKNSGAVRPHAKRTS
jgi:hypothetical protein